MYSVIQAVNVTPNVCKFKTKENKEKNPKKYLYGKSNVLQYTISQKLQDKLTGSIFDIQFKYMIQLLYIFTIGSFNRSAGARKQIL